MAMRLCWIAPAWLDFQDSCSRRACGAARCACFGESPAGYPRRARLGALDAAEPAALDRPGQRPAVWAGPAGTPALAAAGCANACRPDAGGSCPSRHEGRFTDNPPGIAMELPRHASRPAPEGAGAFSPIVGVDLARVRGEPVQPSGGDAERPCLLSDGGGSAQGVLVLL
jgi:hypothetical protein